MAQIAGTDRNQAAERNNATFSSMHGPSIDRRTALTQFTAGLVAAVSATGYLGAQEPSSTQSSGTEKGIPGIDKPMAMHEFTANGYLFNGPGTKVRISRNSEGTFPRTAAGGVVLATALSLEKIGRDRVPKGHMIRISVVGEDLHTREKTTAEYWIKPENVPSSRGIDTETFRQAVYSDRGLEAFVNALSKTNDPDRLGIYVKVLASGDFSSAKFWFVMKDGSPVRMTMQIVPPPDNK